MANYSHSEYKQFGPNILATTANKLSLVKNPAKADSYATFLTKVIATVDIDSGDIAFSNVGNDLQVTIAGQNAVPVTGSCVIGDDLCVAAYSSVTQKVYLVQDATNRAIPGNVGDTATIPPLVTFVRENTAVV